MPAEYLARIESSRPQLYAMAQAQYGLTLNVGPFGVDSRPALIGAKFAEEQGVGEAYHDAVFRAFWQEAQDISHRDVLKGIATAVSLDPIAFLSALDDPHYLALMEADVAQAHAYGLGSVPALVFNNKYLVSGAQPYEVLAEVAEKALAESN
jgi:predicted DsbA family dithiol-disulfide isomerase